VKTQKRYAAHADMKAPSGRRIYDATSGGKIQRTRDCG